MMAKKNNPQKNVLSNFKTQLIVYPVSIVSNIIITRLLGAEDKGNFVFFVMLSGSIVPLLFMGMGNGVIYHINKGRYSLSESFWTFLSFGAFVGAFTGFVFWVLWSLQWLGVTGNEMTYSIITMLLFTSLLSGVDYAFTYILTASDNFRLLNRLNVTYKFFFNITLLIVLYIVTDRLITALIIYVLALLLKLVLMLIIVMRTTKLESFFNWALIKDCFNYGIKAWLGNVANKSNHTLDKVFLGFVSDPSKLGAYSVAYSIANILLILPTSISPVLFNEIAKKNVKEGSELAIKIHAALNILIVPVMIVIMAAAPLIVPFLYGHEFDEAILPLMILLPGIYLFNVSRRVYQKWLGANGYPLLTSKIQLIGLITSVITFPILIPALDILGAAVASSISYVSSSILCYYYFSTKAKVLLPEMFVIRKLHLDYVKVKFKRFLLR